MSSLDAMLLVLNGTIALCLWAARYTAGRSAMTAWLLERAGPRRRRALYGEPLSSGQARRTARPRSYTMGMRQRRGCGKMT